MNREAEMIMQLRSATPKAIAATTAMLALASCNSPSAKGTAKGTAGAIKG